MRTLSMALLLSLVACDPGSIRLVEPGSENVDGVSRSEFTVHVTVDPADSALGDSLGWLAGVPQAEVRLFRNGTLDWIEGQTDSAGVVSFQKLLPGLYRVYAGRTLTAQEAGAVGGVVRAFGDGRTLKVGGKTLELQLLADRPGGLVISEIGNGVPVPWEVGGSYRDGIFFEVYNNGDSTIYLDGKLFGAAWHLWYKDYDHISCAESQPFRVDVAGLYVQSALAFPGSGTEYPIQPGEVKVVAVAAVDHRAVHRTLLDLRDADFEVGGQRTANNPAVPDMVDVGLRRWDPGLLLATAQVYFLAEPADLATLAVIYRDPWGRVSVRIPRDKLLDVAAFTAIWPSSDVKFLPCWPMVHRDFDRYEGGFFGIGEGFSEELQLISLERRLLRVASDGRSILMNTNTSAVDFFVGTKTPGRLP